MVEEKLTPGVAGHLAWMARRVRESRPFYHVRYNDGEAAAMRLVPLGGATENCDGHGYFDGLSSQMCDDLTAQASDRSGDVLIGSIVVTDPPHPTAKALAPWLGGVPNLTAGEFWCQEEKLEGVEELYDLLSALRDSGRCVLVCNRQVVEAAKCLGAKAVVIPEKNAWTTCLINWDAVRQARGPDTCWVWCAGFLGKVWSWQLWNANGRHGSHIDCGHTFDGVCGRKSRGWMERDTPMSRYYFGEFSDYVRMFSNG